MLPFTQRTGRPRRGALSLHRHPRQGAQHRTRHTHCSQSPGQRLRKAPAFRLQVPQLDGNARFLDFLLSWKGAYVQELKGRGLSTISFLSSIFSVCRCSWNRDVFLVGRNKTSSSIYPFSASNVNAWILVHVSYTQVNVLLSVLSFFIYISLSYSFNSEISTVKWSTACNLSKNPYHFSETIGVV